jgi:hypothetical protein
MEAAHSSRLQVHVCKDTWHLGSSYIACVELVLMGMFIRRYWSGIIESGAFVSDIMCRQFEIQQNAKRESFPPVHHVQ